MKRLIFAVLFTALLVVLTGCGTFGRSQEPDPTATPASSTSRSTQTTVKVNETVANAETVNNAASQPSTTAAPVDTPATGDFPVAYLAGVLGLILLCSAGLLLLRRI